jgi:hypothetical protein
MIAKKFPGIDLRLPYRIDHELNLLFFQFFSLHRPRFQSALAKPGGQGSFVVFTILFFLYRFFPLEFDFVHVDAREFALVFHHRIIVGLKPGVDFFLRGIVSEIVYDFHSNAVVPMEFLSRPAATANASSFGGGTRHLTMFRIGSRTGVA